MVRLPHINTGERTLCQDKGTNGSSFWQSVAQKDYSEVYRHPEYKNRASSREAADIQSWTYDYSPRSKANYWDWHHERPVRNDRPLHPTTEPKQDGASEKPAASTRGVDVDYVKDYSTPRDYEEYSKRSDGVRGDRSYKTTDSQKDSGYHDQMTSDTAKHKNDELKDYLQAVNRERERYDRRYGKANSYAAQNQDDGFKDYLQAVNRERERYGGREVKTNSYDVQHQDEKNPDFKDHHHVAEHERYDRRDDRTYGDAVKHQAGDNDDFKDYLRAVNRERERYDRSDHRAQDARGRYDEIHQHGRNHTNDHEYERRPERENQYFESDDKRGHSDVRRHQEHRNTYHYKDLHGTRNYGDTNGSHDHYRDVRNSYFDRNYYGDRYNPNGVTESDAGSTDRNSNNQYISEEERRKQQYMHPNSRRYLSETMSKFKYQESPRTDHKPPSREPALGIVPANEFYEPEPFERMLPNCDREQTFKLPTYPVFSYGRKKKVQDRSLSDNVQITDPEPQDYLLNDKLISRKKFLAGPADCLSVPGQPVMWGFDGGGKQPETISPRRLEQFTSHPSNQTEIDIG